MAAGVVTPGRPEALDAAAAAVVEPPAWAVPPAESVAARDRLVRVAWSEAWAARPGEVGLAVSPGAVAAVEVLAAAAAIPAREAPADRLAATSVSRAVPGPAAGHA